MGGEDLRYFCDLELSQENGGRRSNIKVQLSDCRRTGWYFEMLANLVLETDAHAWPFRGDNRKHHGVSGFGHCGGPEASHFAISSRLGEPVTMLVREGLRCDESAYESSRVIEYRELSSAAS